LTLGALPASQPSSWPAFSMPPRKHGSFGKRPRRPPRGPAAAPLELRIIGGRFRRRKLLYGGDPRVRPMKDRIREAIFNLLGPAVQGKHAIDLFAGTGALALEALSRGARHATLIERHVPTAEIVRRNMAALDVSSICDLVTAARAGRYAMARLLVAAVRLLRGSGRRDAGSSRRDGRVGAGREYRRR
jgi:hypothetical protein